MTDFDWSRFTTGINVKASIDKLYRAWSTRSGIEEWFLRLAEFSHADGTLLEADEKVKPGDVYKWLWHGWPDETEEKGMITDANGSNKIRFSFGKAGICTVQIEPYGDEYIVQLKQEEIPVTEEGKQTWHIGCKTGWTFYLANLKSVLEGGIDLRNKDISLQELLNK
jgi:uncharacterized protein YndB with AHSA1/START domain